MTFDPGRVRLTLTMDEGVVSRAGAACERPDVARLLRGQPAEQAVALVPLIYSLCGKAQGIAARVALDAARGDPVETHVDADVLAEAAREHAWKLFIDWPRQLGLDPDEAASERSHLPAVEALIDLMVQTGPYEGLDIETLRAHPHGIDLGPLEPRLDEILRTTSGLVELCPDPIAADVPRLVALLDETPDDSLLLVGRRHLRSNNSWMHNIEVLVKGKPRCTLQIHPDDATRFGIEDGQPVRVRSRVGEVEIDASVTDGIMPGVVSIPHGWGHAGDGVGLGVARRYAGVNSNLLADRELFDPLSGNAVLNGIPVTVEALVPAPA